MSAWAKAKLLILAMHIFALLGLVFCFDLTWFIVSLFVWVIYYGYGFSIGFHRLWSHKAFLTTPFVKYSTLIVGTLAGCGSIVGWVGQHRQHHAYSDVSKQLDPYWAHDDYSFLGTVKAWIETPRSVNFGVHLVKDLFRDKWAKFTHNHYYKIFFSWCLLLIIIHPMAFIYICAIPSMLCYSSAQISGVLGHRIGKSVYDVGDKSKDSHWLNILSFGEAYQNTHHKYPSSYRLGKYDLSAFFIEKLFLVKSKI